MSLQRSLRPLSRTLPPKAAARALATRLGLPTIPGGLPVDDEAQAKRAFAALGAPMLLKATNAGGGRGLLRVDGHTDVATAFVDHVVPLLQKKGIFRTEYPGTTLRETLGLERPGDGFENYVPPVASRHSGGSGAGKIPVGEAAFG